MFIIISVCKVEVLQTTINNLTYAYLYSLFSSFMLLEFYLSRIEKQFFQYPMSKNNFNGEATLSFKIVSTSLNVAVIGEIRDYILSFEKILFETEALEALDESKIKIIDKYLESLRPKLTFLNQLLSCYAAGYHENLIQAQFYKLLVGSLESIRNKTHPAFTDKESFLARESSISHMPFPEGTVSNSDIKKVPKIHILKAPEKVIAAFESLFEQGFCDIYNVPAFVYNAFTFPANYKVPQDNGFFTFLWKKNPSYHSLTVLIKDLYDKKSITDNKAALEEWLSVLLPLVSQGSIKKYLSSKGKEFSEKNRIDIQLFN